MVRGGLAAGAALAVPGLLGRAAAATLPTLRASGAPRVGRWRVLAGSLHDHTIDSDGDAASDVVATWLHAHRSELGIDFATLSDHSDFFPGSPLVDGAPLDPWNRQADLVRRFSGPDFSLVRGFEWTNDQQNHLNVLMSSNWTSRFTTGDVSLGMRPFWEWLSIPANAGGGGDGLCQFNHPGDKGALNWDDYALDDAGVRQTCTTRSTARRTATDVGPATPAGTGSPCPVAGMSVRS